MNKKGRIAITEILILLISIFAFGYVLGSEFEIVSGQGSEEGEQKNIASAIPVATSVALGFRNNGLTESGFLEFDRTIESTLTIDGVEKDFGIVSARPLASGGAIVKNAAGETVQITGTQAKDVGILDSKGEIPTNLLKEKQGSSFVSKFLGLKTGKFPDAIVSGAQWGVTVYFLAKFVGGFLFDTEKEANAFAMALGAGTFVGKGVTTLLGPNGALAGKSTGNFLTFGGRITNPSTAGFVWGGAVAVVIFALMYKKETIKVVDFQCNIWQPPTGGARCEECNKQGLPCSEYQCRSLGQACELENKGTSDERCVWKNRQDVQAPVLEPWKEVLTDGFDYRPDTAVSPPDRGTKIVYLSSTTGCVKAFTPFSFGIQTNEPSRCRIDFEKKEKIADMQFAFGGSNILIENHTQILTLPGPQADETGQIVINNDNDYSLFVKCEDANGNDNKNEFVFSFCVEEGPDVTPPYVVSTSLINGMPVSYNQTSLDLDVYVNEPASCKWSTLDKDYTAMENTMSCSSDPLEMNAQMLYTCRTTLTGLKDRQESEFYFRCKDQPNAPENDRIEMRESYVFKVKGTEPLILDKVGPSGTIKDSTDVIKVTLTAETSAGYKEGQALCYYSQTGENDDYIEFFKTNSHSHSTELNLISGNYRYFIKCVDLGGNADVKETSFTVEADNSAPMITRVYHDESYLKFVTNEKASCVYSKDSCSYPFDDGIKITVFDDKEHFTEWNTNNNYYIKCADEFGNQPIGNQCSIIVRPSKEY